MQTKVTVLNGLNTIGGNVVAFERNDTRILMDFGINFAPADSRPEDLLSTGILPNVPELFTDEAGDGMNNVLFISHLHLDHMGALPYLTKPVDVYMSPESARLYEALKLLGVEKAPFANVKVLPAEETVEVGPFTVTGYLTDHDAMGAYMFRVSDGVHEFVHSGDVRLDGPHPDRVKRWASILHDSHPDLFFIEGTEFSFEPNPDRVRRTEMSLLDDFATALAEPKLVVINPYERNVERLMNLQATAKAAGRTLLWDKHFATILHAMGATEVKVYGIDANWADLVKDPDKYVLQNRFVNLHELDRFNGYSYLHMNGEPLGDYDPRYQVLLDFLAERGIAMTVMGASGHATPADLVTIAQTVAAETTIPWHSFKPEVEADALRAAGLNVLEPEKGQALVFED